MGAGPPATDHRVVPVSEPSLAGRQDSDAMLSIHDRVFAEPRVGSKRRAATELPVLCGEIRADCHASLSALPTHAEPARLRRRVDVAPYINGPDSESMPARSETGVALRGGARPEFQRIQAALKARAGLVGGEAIQPGGGSPTLGGDG